MLSYPSHFLPHLVGEGEGGGEIFKSGLKESKILINAYFNIVNFPISEP